ncbi:MAG: UDP-2,3-diacylglucosamine diphosphatase [Thiotrichales bacterium]
MLRYRSVFISDIHLGSKDCKAEYLLDFLRSVECEQLYLVGDIFDFWAMRKSVHWTDTQSAVIQLILYRARQGIKITYIPGNHDALMREFCGLVYEGISVERNAVFNAADGRQFFVSHGDEFDAKMKHSLLTRMMGDKVYYYLLSLNRYAQRIRNAVGLKYWSLSGFLKTRSRKVNDYIRRFELAAARRAKYDHYDGYICGHIHKPGIEEIEGVLYCNDGDWVETCTALVEDKFGNIHLLHWSDHQRVEQVAESDADTLVKLPVSGLANS